MADVERIIKAIDEFLERRHQQITTPVEINPYLKTKGILNESATRPELPIRKILRKGWVPHAYQVGVYWQIPHFRKALTYLQLISGSNSVKEKNRKNWFILKTIN